MVSPTYVITIELQPNSWFSYCGECGLLDPPQPQREEVARLAAYAHNAEHHDDHEVKTVPGFMPIAITILERQRSAQHFQGHSHYYLGLALVAAILLVFTSGTGWLAPVHWGSQLLAALCLYRSILARGAAWGVMHSPDPLGELVLKSLPPEMR